MSGQGSADETGNGPQDSLGTPQPEPPSLEQGDGSDPGDLRALCFSGGGIRSATFNLGVLQELARNGGLKRFDYLSTVSGGGYIGAWFMAQIARARHKLGDERAAEAAVIASLARADEAGEPPTGRGPEEEVNVPLALKWLRDYSNYLSPTWGLSKDALSLVSIYLRNLAIHWMILLPVLIAVLLVPRLVHWVLHDPSQHVDWLLWAVVGSTLLIAAFSTNGPPAKGEVRSRRINLVWHVVCFILPLLVMPIGLTALVSTRDGLVALGGALEVISLGLFPSTVFEDGFERAGLNPAGVLSPAAGFAYAGAVLYVCGSLLLVLARSLPWILGKDGDWRFPTPKGFKFKPSMTVGKNFEEWRKSLPLRLPLAIASGALIGAFCGFAATISAVTAPFWSTHAELRTALLPVLFVFAIWLGSVLRVAIATRRSNELAREWWARATGATLIGLLLWVALALVVLWLPLFLLELPQLRTGWAAGAAGLGGFLFAAVTAAVGFWSKHGASIAEHAERWRDRLGKRLTEIAALLTLLGASLVLNLLVGSVAFQFTENGDVSKSSAQIYACASSARADILGTELVARQAISCRLGEVLLSEMHARGFPESDIVGARNRFAACCLASSAGKPSSGDTSICPTNEGESGSIDVIETDWRSAGSSVLDMPCPLQTPPEALTTSCGAKAGAPTCETPKPPAVYLAAALPWSLQMAVEYRWGLEHTDALSLVLCLLVLIVLSVLTAFLTGANTYSLQAMYANRLVRAYLGASNFGRREVDPQLRFDDSDDMPLSHLRGARPKLVINAALNHTQAEAHVLAWQQRKASSFTFDPNAAEFEALAPATLGQAISISGAAVSPSMGYHSSPAVSAVLALFNLRLGRWVPRPHAPETSEHENWWRRFKGVLRCLIDPWCLLLKEFLSKVGSRGRFIYLSDGGHFENLGIYSMLQRRCRYILAVDAGADLGYEFADLDNLIRKARVDLGVEIEISNAENCIQWIREGRLRYLHVRIRYPKDSDPARVGPSEGELVLLKPVLCGDEPFDVRRYAETVAKRSSRFPQQSTADQFFDESQFESYRILGRHTVQKVFGADGDWPSSPVRPVGGPYAPLATRQSEIGMGGAATGSGGAGLFSGAMDAVNSLGSVGQAAVLASAIGVVGVTGMVTLQNTTLSIDQASLEQLRDVRMRLDEESVRQLQNLNWKVDLNEGAKVSLGASGFGAELTEQLKKVRWAEVLAPQEWKDLREALRAVVNEITLKVQAADDLPLPVRLTNPGTASVDPQLLERLQAITNALIEAATSVDTSTRNLDEALEQLHLAVDELMRAVEAGNPVQILGTLRQINTALSGIESRVEEISPRNTVRATR
ncbi:MAG: patatin-like phospholipase family protein [Xanthomonadales bacterium]|nr:patatin-like phospholipase family protein [Xanthomonadales bacterium]